MRSLCRVGSIVMVLVSCVAPGAAWAQSVAEAGTVSVTPFVGAAFGTSDNLGGSLVLGAGVEYDVTKHVGVEGELGYAFDVLGSNANEDWSLTNVSANGIYNFDAPHVTPYATFGIGFERSSPSVKVLDPAASYPAASTEVSYNFGGGVKYPLSDRFLVRGDLRRFESVDLAPDYWRLYGGLTWWIKR
jgi:opacity protein-like surface antigen